MHQDLTNTSKKSKAIRFEEEIKSFMARLGFENVDGAKDTFLINGIQVDVCGGHEDTLLVVECTMTQELKKKSIREKIKEFRGVTSSLEKGFKSSPIYKKYKFTKYMLATKNIGIRKEDIIFANYKNLNIYNANVAHAPRWRSGYAIACRAIPFRFESGPWLMIRIFPDLQLFPRSQRTSSSAHLQDSYP